jgi:hypothetical protein
MLTGRSVTGILHLCNQTLIEWYSKRQATVETATFGSEFTAARIAVDQIIDLRTTLRYLGVPVHKKSFMFGDNQSVVINSTIPYSSLNKRHNALAYHRVREMIAADILGIGLMERITQRMLSANIGDINRFGNSSNHFYSIQELQVTFWNM